VGRLEIGSPSCKNRHKEEGVISESSDDKYIDKRIPVTLCERLMQMATLLFSTVLLIALDQLAKASVVSRLREGESVSFGILAIRRILNQKVPGRFFQGNTALVALWGAEVVLLVVIVELGPFSQGVVAPTALGAALGGAGSNLLDRLRRGGVVDFIDLGFWPVFNLADVAIVAGVLVSVFFI
jgi:signal peptidase II